MSLAQFYRNGAKMKRNICSSLLARTKA